MGISEREKKYDNDIWVEEAWIGEESKQVNKKTHPILKRMLSTQALVLWF